MSARHQRRLQKSFAGGEVSEHMYARYDDPKSQNGAALMLNFLPKPQGAAQRRPGTQLVRPTKYADAITRLLSFTFSESQSLVVEATRRDADTYGHFRFHTDGSTLLYRTPSAYKAPNAATLLDPVASALQTAANHGLASSDPIVLTCFPTPGAAPQVSVLNSAPGTPQEIDITWPTIPGMGRAAAPNGPQQFCMVPDPGGALPDHLEAGRLYWTKSATLQAGSSWTTGTNNVVRYTFSKTFQGDEVEGASAVHVNPVRIAAMPEAIDGFPLRANEVLYALVTTANQIRLCRSLSDVQDGIYVTYRTGSDTTLGTPADLRVHYAYTPGALVDSRNAGSGGDTYCRRAPWCSAPNPFRHNYSRDNDHQGHTPTEPLWWHLMPTVVDSVAAVAPATDIIQTTSPHGLALGDPVVLSGTTAPGNLAFGTVYYAIPAAASDELQLSATPFGAAIDITSSGATITLRGNPIYEVPHDYREADLEALTTAQSNNVLTIACQDRPVAELRRVSGDRWEIHDVDFEAPAPPPDQPYLAAGSIDRGTAEKIVGLTVLGGADEFHTDADHNFLPGDHVQFMDETGVPMTGVAGFTDDVDAVYLVDKADPGGLLTRFTIKSRTTGDSQDALTGSPTGQPLVRYIPDPLDGEQVYVVTSIDANNDESGPSDEITIENFLSVDGASNTIYWRKIPNAVRYRIYKKVDGVFGFIGEAGEDDLFGFADAIVRFTDDNIGPDLNISPPLRDLSLRKVSRVTFDQASDTVVWPEHGLANGTPVVFRTSGEMPGIIEGRTYYVAQSSENSFQLLFFPTNIDTIDINGTDDGDHWAIAGGFPAAVTYYEQRRAFGGGRAFPQDVWMTVSGTEASMAYSIPTVDSDRVYFRMASREVASIRHLVPLSHLVLMTNSTEMRVTPINDDAITPTSISIRPQSFIGSSTPQPVLINNSVVFVARRGGHIREMGYNSESMSYLTGDLSLRAQHLFDGLDIVDLAFQKAPIPTVWAVSSGGKLLSMTYVPEEGVGAWAQHTTDGTFEAVAVIPEGEEDAVYVVVLRDGVRYVERFAQQFTGRLAPVKTLADAVHLDACVIYDGTATTVVQGLAHLEGSTVTYLADGLPGTAVVSGGQITLATAASKVVAGLPFLSQLDTFPLYMDLTGFGSGANKNIKGVFVRVFESGAFLAGPLGDPVRASDEAAAGQVVTRIQEIPLPGHWDEDGQVTLQQSDPLPLTIIGLTVEVATGN